MEKLLYNITFEELEQNKFLMFIGISVGVKPMNQEIALDYLNWTLSYASQPVQILIADEIARYNYLVFSHYTDTGAFSRAIRDGDVYQNFFENIIDTYLPEKKSMFHILRWKDIQNSRFNEIKQLVQEEFNDNVNFQNDLFSILDPYIKRRGKSLAPEKRVFLSQYLIEELATLLDGIYVNGFNYRFILYPTYRFSGMSQLVSDIQYKKRYSDLSNKLNLESTIMVESLIEQLFPLEVANSPAAGNH